MGYGLAVGNAGYIDVQAGEAVALHLRKELGDNHLLTLHGDKGYPLAGTLADADGQVLVGREVDSDFVILLAIDPIAEGKGELQVREFLLLPTLFGPYPIGVYGVLEIKLSILEVYVVADIVPVGTALEDKQPFCGASK